MRTKFGVMVAALGLFCVVAPAVAHHGFDTEYDANKKFKHQGVVKAVLWTNPHMRVYIDVTGPDGKVTNWNQVDPSFPDQELVLAGPGTDSGTFDYFTDEINGEEGASRSDYTASEDDNVTVQAVAGDAGGLGYLGFTYYEENIDSLKAVEIDGGDGCVMPSVDSARDGTYVPLSRPLFIYAKNESLAKPEVYGFVEYFLTNSIQLAEDALFIPVPDDQVATNLSTLESAGT